jgi:NAD(P)-dependent dehydrogenase (short-subunit alcohol dehydrogenase family)
MGELSGRVALVTGAGLNIGQAIARTLAAKGAAVVCNNLDGKVALQVVDAVEREGGRAVAAPGNVTDPETVRGFLKIAEDAFGPIDILVTNPTTPGKNSILNTSLEEFQRVLNVVLTGSYLCAKAVAERLIELKRPGAFVLVASTSGHRGRPDAFAYCTAKGGALNMARAMAQDLAQYNIRVNSATPTRTGPKHSTWDEIPLGRLGEPQDLANAIAFLVSDAAAFITGEDLRVDGGALATWGRGKGEL